MYDSSTSVTFCFDKRALDVLDDSDDDVYHAKQPSTNTAVERDGIVTGCASFEPTLRRLSLLCARKRDLTLAITASICRVLLVVALQTVQQRGRSVLTFEL